MIERPATQRMVAVDQGRVRLHTLLAGPEDGPLAVLLHGFPDTSHGWRRQVPALVAAGWRVAVPDQRGYATSDKPPGLDAYRLERLARDVVDLAGALGRRRFAVVGHDWGGIVAWALALGHPDRVERAVILNAPHPATVLPYSLRHPGQLARSWYVLAFQLPGVPERMFRAGDFRLARRALLATSRPGTVTADDLRRYREAWAQPGAVTGMLNWYRALRRRAPLPQDRVRVPTLVLWGDRDAFLQPGLADAALERCDDGRLVRFADLGHWLHQEDPARVNPPLIHFLDAHFLDAGRADPAPFPGEEKRFTTEGATPGRQGRSA
ncbi:alpha/beta hydrolase [Azospirillum sp.]|uniref:alpha/beta fold hydrolase n=1 Tax=Azospirillum sp. TaxID=34012 RepID=UPI002D76B33D|nr:alpha/beta hydrolase [Azospirillum sp.]